jgi:hypothetical protein
MHDPPTVVYIHVRVSRAAFDRFVACGRSVFKFDSVVALPNLPFTGFIQANSVVCLSRLQAWLDSIWSPVVSKLCSNPQYRKPIITDAGAAEHLDAAAHLTRLQHPSLQQHLRPQPHPSPQRHPSPQQRDWTYPAPPGRATWVRSPPTLTHKTCLLSAVGGLK